MPDDAQRIPAFLDAKFTVLESACLLELIRDCDDTATAMNTIPGVAEMAVEFAELRADARTLFTESFFTVN